MLPYHERGILLEDNGVWLRSLAMGKDYKVVSRIIPEKGIYNSKLGRTARQDLCLHDRSIPDSSFTIDHKNSFTIYTMSAKRLSAP